MVKTPQGRVIQGVSNMTPAERQLYNRLAKLQGTMLKSKELNA